MAAPVSVVIPVLDAAPGLGPCLGALSEALFEGLVREVILADGGGGAAIAEVAEATGCVLVRAPRGRGVQLAAGAAAARGEWFLFLHGDTVLGPGWVAAVRAHVAAGPLRAGWFRLRFDAEGFWPRRVAGWANVRSRWLGLPYGDQGLLVPRGLYEAAGGYPPVPLMEDVALVRRLRGRLAELPAEAVTSAARYRRDGWLRRGARNLATLALWRLGASEAWLARFYERR